MPHTALQTTLEQHHPCLALGQERSGACRESGVELLDIGAAVGLGLRRVQLLHVQWCVRQDELA